MENLLQNLQRTIKALETLSEKNLPQSEELDELLDQLFQQKIDLVNFTTNTGSSNYQQTCQSLGQTATRAEKAIKNPAQIEELILAVKDSTGKITSLLNNT